MKGFLELEESKVRSGNSICQNCLIFLEKIFIYLFLHVFSSPLHKSKLFEIYHYILFTSYVFPDIIMGIIYTLKRT